MYAQDNKSLPVWIILLPAYQPISPSILNHFWWELYQIVIKQSTNLELNEPIDGVVMNVKELTHSQQQPQVPKTHKKKPTIRQAIRTVFRAL